MEIAIEVSVLTGGHAIAGNRRGPRINGDSEGAHINLRKGDSFDSTGILFTGDLLFFPMTDLSPRGRRLLVATETGINSGGGRGENNAGI